MEQLGAGLDGIEDWLEARGFYVARDAHANYGRTVLSLAATLNMTPLDEVAARLGPDSDDPAPVHALLRDHAVGRFLKARGYRYLHIGSWFAPTRTSSLADENLVMADGSDFEAKLEETTFRPTLDDLLGVPDPPAHHVLHRTTALWQLREFDRVYREPGPKFVLLHVLLPHEPYVFDEVGDYPSDAQRAARGEGENYRQQMVFVSDHIKRIVDRLLDAPPDERPVIIVAGDEGPFPVRYARGQGGLRLGRRHGLGAGDEVRHPERLLPAWPSARGGARAVPDDVVVEHVPRRARSLLRRGHPAAARSELHVEGVGAPV